MLGTIELDESKICTCLAISDTVNAPPGAGGGMEEGAAPEAVLAPPTPQHIMPGRGVPIM